MGWGGGGSMACELAAHATGRGKGAATRVCGVPHRRR